MDKKTAETIIQLVKEKKPENIEELVNPLRARSASATVIREHQTKIKTFV